MKSTALSHNPTLLVYTKNFITPIEQYHDLEKYSEHKYTLKNGEELHFSNALLKAIEQIDVKTHYKTTIQEAMDQAKEVYFDKQHQIVKDLHSFPGGHDEVELKNDQILCEFRTVPSKVRYPASDIRCIGYRIKNKYFFTEIGGHKDIDKNKIKVIFGIAHQYAVEKIDTYVHDIINKDTYVNDIINKSYLEEFIDGYQHHPNAHNDI